MSSPRLHQRVQLTQFADRFRSEMVPLANRICYFAAALSLSDEDRREYIDEPVAALPPAISAQLPPIRIFLVPYLCKGPAHRRRTSPEAFVSTEPPESADALASSTLTNKDDAVLAFAVKDAEVAGHHYRFYRAIAQLLVAAPASSVPAPYITLLEAELQAGIHGEADQLSWRLKSELTRRDANFRRLTERLRAYCRQSFIDTLTLYLHGICCDIDIEPGPRQLPSSFLRKRFALLKETYPPPPDYAVFPEDL